MRRRHSFQQWAALAAALVVLSLPSGTIRAGQEAVPLAINVGAAEGSPGTTVVVGVTVRGPDGATVTGFEEDVRFDTRVLAFDKVEVSPLGKTAGLQVTASSNPDPADQSYSIVRVKATSERPMRGPVLGLMFQIKDGVKGGTKIALSTKARVATAGQAALTDVGGKDGEVTVTDEAVVFGCFFYMH